MFKRSNALLALLITIGMVLAACAPAAPAFECTDALGCVDIAPGDPIHFAYALSVSGATAPLGEDARGGVEIAIDDKGGELLSHPIELTGEDTLCNAEGGQAAGTKLAADKTIVAIIGTTCSSEARSAMPLISEAGMTMISPSNTNPDLTNPDHPDHHPGYLRTAHNDLFQGRIAAEFAYNELGFTTAATIHDGSPYAQSLQEVFADVFQELGGTITAQEAVNVGDTDMKPVLTSIATGSPQIIYFPIFEPEGDLVAQQAKEVSGLESTALMGADGLFADSSLKRLVTLQSECTCPVLISIQPKPAMQSSFRNGQTSLEVHRRVGITLLPTTRPISSLQPLRKWQLWIPMARYTSADRPCAMLSTPQRTLMPYPVSLPATRMATAQLVRPWPSIKLARPKLAATGLRPSFGHPVSNE
jgi:ABC-type branched-subunit amino acid transport system substrate-binding protein